MNGESFSPKKVTEDISVPGMIVRNAAAAKQDDTRIRVQRFGLGPDSAETDSLMLEALLNRDDVFIIDYHKYTFQHAFYVVITYSEPRVPEKTQEKKDA